MKHDYNGIIKSCTVARHPKIKKVMKMCRRLRFLFIVVILLGSVIPGLAQYKIKGRIIDENSDPLPYAHVVLLNPADSTLQYYDVADKNGLYELIRINPGKYLMQFSFVTKKLIWEEVRIPSSLGENFGDKMMEPALLDEYIVTAEYVPIKIDQDTVTFNAKAFKTREGAVVEDLLKEIPGIEVDKAGNMKALGEDVTKVLVDGKEFFSGDNKVATKNLPADAIDKIQVFDKKSEEAEFMGIDDGVQDRTINLLLNEDSKKGYFGNQDIGAGTKTNDNYRYKSKGNLYRFSSTVQTALLGQYNNINEFGFTGKGQGQFGQQINGLNTAGAGGINLSYNSMKYNRYYVSYLGNTVKTDRLQTTSTENFIPDGSYYQDSNMVRDERNTPNSLRYGIHHRFNKSHNIIIRGNVTASSNKSVTNTLTDSRLNDNLVNSLDNRSTNKSDNTSFTALGNDIIKINGDKTQLKTNFVVSYNKNSSELDWTNKTTLYQDNQITINDQFQNNTIKNQNLSFNPTLVQKLSKLWTVHANFNLGSNKRELIRSYGISNTLTDSLSPDFNTNESFLNPTITLQRATSKKFMSFSFGSRWVNFDKVLNNSSLGKSEYFYFLPRFNYRNNYRSGRRLNIGYNSSIGLPGLTQLLPVTNKVNQLSFYLGNSALKPEYRHSVNLQWSYFDAFSFTSFFTRINGGYTKDKISMSQTINENLTKINRPVNVDYNYYVSSNSNFSTPIRPLGINISARLNESWSKGISVVNSEDNIQTVLTHSIDVSLSNRRQDKLDITIGGAVTVTDAKYSIAEQMNNVYYNTSYYTDIFYTVNDQLTFGAEANIVNYNAESFKESVSVPLINASIRYFFLKGNKAGIILKGYDLLNKFTNFQQTNGPNFIMEQENNTIGRYVMLSFMLRIGKF